MGKIISAYGDFTATVIKSKASNTCDMAVVGTDVDCTNLSVSKVKNVLSEGVTGVGALCQSANVNKWSNFCSRYWSLTVGVLSDIVRFPYSLGYFAGYNHNAPAPNKSVETATIHAQSGATINTGVACSLDIGEIDWTSLGGITKIGFESKIDGMSQGVTYYDINTNIFDLQNLFTTTQTTGKTIVSELFFANASNVKVASIPNVSTFNTSLIIDYLAAIGNIALSEALIGSNPGWFLNVGDSSLNQDSEGYSIVFSGIMDETTSSFISGSFALYAQLNSGSMVSCSKTVNFYGTGDSQTIAGTLPFGISWNDVVFFELQ